MREFALTFWYSTFPNVLGRFSPWSLLSSGLGSNVSKWDGPPAWNRKIIDLAFAGKCGAFGASGFFAASAAISEPKPMAPKPQKQSVKNSRRLRAKRICSLMLVHVEKGIGIEQRKGELGGRGRVGIVQILERQQALPLIRRPSRGEAERIVHPFARRPGEPLRQR